MKIVAIMGKAGSGKDTILKRIIKKYPEKFNEIVSCTTRPPREGELDGINYHFLSVEEFTKRVLNGDMLEATEFNGWHYGTAKSALSEEKTNIGVFNPAGIYCLMEEKDIDLQVYFIQTQDKLRLMRQLSREEDPNIEEIIRRYGADKIDFEDVEDIDYISLRNNTKEDLDFAVQMIGQN